MPQEALLRFVQDVRRQAQSPATLGAVLKADSDKLSARFKRPTKALTVEQLKRKSILDSI